MTQNLLIGQIQRRQWGFTTEPNQALIDLFFNFHKRVDDSNFSIYVLDNPLFVETTPDVNVLLIGGVTFLAKYHIKDDEFQYVSDDTYNFLNICKLSDTVYVLVNLKDNKNNFVLYDLEENEFTEIKHQTEMQFKWFEQCQGITVSQSNDIYYSNIGEKNEIVRLIKKGHAVYSHQVFISETEDNPMTVWSLCAYKNELFVSDHCKRAVVAYTLDGKGGRLVCEGYDNQQLHKPTQMRVLGDKLIFCTNFIDFLLQVDLEPVQKPKAERFGTTSFQFVSNFCFDTRINSQFLVDRINKRVIRAPLK